MRQARRKQPAPSLLHSSGLDQDATNTALHSYGRREACMLFDFVCATKSRLNLHGLRVYWTPYGHYLLAISFGQCSVVAFCSNVVAHPNYPENGMAS